jgi:hypothetical protein
MIVKILQLVCVLVAASILGQWYLSEYRKARLAGQPWYRAYLTLPGVLIILLMLLLPLIVRFI